MWNEKTRTYTESNRLAILGVVQEQHAERTRLYAQWKQFAWPIVQDPLTKLNLSGVPIAVLIDEHGIVRSTKARPNQLGDFMKTDFEASASNKQNPADDDQSDRTLRELVNDADATLLWQAKPNGEPNRRDAAIREYENAHEKYPDSAKLMFRLGVAYRMRFDSPNRKPNDFDQAVKFWSKALQQNPNQYIWRRRIQQYGPRQMKPYPFYDWVDQAIADIRKRGETPVELSVPLSGAEIAHPAKKIEIDQSAVRHPDPDDRITTDSNLVEIHATVVPPQAKPGDTVRVHLSMKPANGKWNNEAEPLRVWINSDSSGKPATHMVVTPNPDQAQSLETRNVDFEFVTSDSTTCSINGFALFHACLPDSGQCVFRRKNFTINVPLTE